MSTYFSYHSVTSDTTWGILSSFQRTNETLAIQKLCRWQIGNFSKHHVTLCRFFLSNSPLRHSLKSDISDTLITVTKFFCTFGCLCKSCYVKGGRRGQKPKF